MTLRFIKAETVAILVQQDASSHVVSILKIVSNFTKVTVPVADVPEHKL